MSSRQAAASGRPIPNALTIAGVDPSGGAGILADVKAMSALGAYGCAVIAALTAQNTQGVTGISPVPPAFVGEQGVDLHPVMVAKSGDLLLERDAVGAMREAMLPQATLLTPNLPEAGVLLEERPVETVKEMRRVAERLRNKMAHSGQRWVMVKGGHLPGNDTIDLLHDGDRMIELPGHRIETANTHGTGCTLSAALAALLPQVEDVPEAARRAKAYLTEAIRHAERLSVGSGHGPVHHFHAWW